MFVCNLEIYICTCVYICIYMYYLSNPLPMPWYKQTHTHAHTHTHTHKSALPTPCCSQEFRWYLWCTIHIHICMSAKRYIYVCVCVHRYTGISATMCDNTDPAKWVFFFIAASFFVFEFACVYSIFGMTIMDFSQANSPLGAAGNVCVGNACLCVWCV